MSRGSVRHCEGLGLSIHQIADTKKPVMVVSTGLPVVIVPVRTLTAVRSIVPDAAAIVEVCERVGTTASWSSRP